MKLEQEADALADLTDMKWTDIDDYFRNFLTTSGLAEEMQEEEENLFIFNDTIESPDASHVTDGGNGEDGEGGPDGGVEVGGGDGADCIKCNVKTVGDKVDRGARAAEGVPAAQGRTGSCRRLDWYWEGVRKRESMCLELYCKRARDENDAYGCCCA